MNVSKQKNMTFLSLAILLTVTLHLLAGYGISGMEISHDTSESVALMENRAEHVNLYENHQLNTLEDEKKNAILAEAFQNLYSDNYQEANTVNETDSAFSAFDDIDDQMVMMEPSTSSIQEALWNDKVDEELLSIDEKDFLESLSESSSELFLPEGFTQLLHPDEDRFAKDIIQATESQHGSVIDDTITYYTELPSVQLGVEDAAFDEGNFLQDRSGLIEQGRTDAEATNDAGILPQYMGPSDHDEDLIAYITQDDMRSTIGAAQRKSCGASDPWYNPSASDRQATIGHIASSEDFDVNIQYTPYGKGYLFRIELDPKRDIQFRRIKQNVTFLIDRSYSIEKNRFHLTKQAVADAIRALSPEDSFNIIVFDQDVTKLASHPIPRNANNIQRASRFLNEQQHGSMFTATDVTSPLNGIIPKIVAENEINAAILLSDGDTTLNPSGQWETIRDWTEENSGKVSLYSLASGQKNNYPMLDMISVFNKGSLYVAKNHQQIKPTLRELMNDIQTPIGKNIVATIVPKNETTTVRTYPSQEHLPNLYDNKPFVIYGYTNSLDDFYLFFQGRYYDKRINIKQLVNLRNGEQVDAYDLEKAWALQNAYEFYKKYLSDGNETHLHEAKKLLRPYNLSIAIGY